MKGKYYDEILWQKDIHKHKFAKGLFEFDSSFYQSRVYLNKNNIFQKNETHNQICELLHEKNKDNNFFTFLNQSTSFEDVLENYFDEDNFSIIELILTPVPYALE